MLIGNLGRDPELKYSQQGTAIAQFSVATTERWKDKSGELQEHTEWFAVESFGRRAEIVGESLHKAHASISKAGNARSPGTTNKRVHAHHDGAGAGGEEGNWGIGRFNLAKRPTVAALDAGSGRSRT